MTVVKRVCSFVLSVVLALSIVTIPAFASMSDFAYFPRVNGSMVNTYKAETVAVQRFLMKFDDDFSRRISLNGGTDGRCGPGTVLVIKDFQTRTGLTSDGDVGSNTWLKIESKLTDTGVDSVGTVWAMGNAASAATRSNWVIALIGGYVAYTQDNIATDYFYP